MLGADSQLIFIIFHLNSVNIFYIIIKTFLKKQPKVLES